MQNVPVALDTLVRYELGSHILHLALSSSPSQLL